MQAVEERVSDQAVLKLLRAMLRAGVMEGGQVRREVTGTPQGGPASPLLCNIYLHRLDRVRDAGQHGVLVRYCDDLVVMCSTRQQAEAALARLRQVLAGLGLELKAAKTRIVHLTEDKDAEGFDFLGFHHRWVRARGTVSPSRVCFLARWPSRKAAQHARDRIRQITDRKRLLMAEEWIVEELNWFLRGWGGYFRYGNSARTFDAISQYALERLAGFAGKRHKRSARWGMRLVTCGSPDNFGLITLCGTVIAPRSGPGEHRPNAGGEERRRAVCGKTACTVRRGGAGNGASATAPVPHPTVSDFENPYFLGCVDTVVQLARQRLASVVPVPDAADKENRLQSTKEHRALPSHEEPPGGLPRPRRCGAVPAGSARGAGPGAGADRAG